LRFRDNKEKDDYLKDYAARKIYWRERNSYYHDSITSFLKTIVPAGSSVLEVGCGTGKTLDALHPSVSAGIEINNYLIEYGKKICPEHYPCHAELVSASGSDTDIIFYNADVEDENSLHGLYSRGVKFDYIIISDLIGTLDDIQFVFERLIPFSHGSTKIIVTYYNYFWNPVLRLGELFKLKMKEGEKNWLYIEEIKNLLYLSGYDVSDSGSFLLFPKRIPFLSAFINNHIAKLPGFRRLCLTGWVTGMPSEIHVPKKSSAITAKEEFSVTVLIPCRNEEGNIDKIINRIPALGSHKKVLPEIIFAEGNSTDNTYRKIEELIKENPGKDIRLVKQTGKGKADAVRAGFDVAKGDILIILDADMTVAPEDLSKFYNALRDRKGDFINGTRLVYQMEEKAMRRMNKFGNIFFSKIFSWLLGQRITDTLCGTKALFKSDYEKIKAKRAYFGDFDPFGDFDLLFGASKLKLKIIEIPIRYGERKYGETNIHRFRDGFRLLKMCFVALRKIKFAKQKV